ncbi:pyrroline-5-carboxylate reductase [Streptomyces sp. TS71-3]|uniref:pyrroline-5-carboxylate reductase n=1 Tax=Streptomyces sp. TS71-3 TaxID=2733862 RepID=UPI001B26B066|nr:pyrroline-5-carboxylate reductase [Streptomyces sp. TS71-3]GHJ39262.1 pyrroline-5-carboxylate reductase [Streptomyces sp. TS71-3]
MSTSERPPAGTLSVIGGGNIAEALLSGLLLGEGALFGAEHVSVVEPDPDRAAYMRSTYGISVVAIEEAATADTLVIAVKPHFIDDVLGPLADRLTDRQLVISVVGAVTAGQIEAGLNGKVPVVRCMPNTPAAVGEGITAINRGAYASEADLERTEAILSAVGRVVRVTEAQLDVVTGLSGSGPAYFYYLAEALIDAGVLLGLQRPLAAELVTQTLVGSGALIRTTGKAPDALRVAVSSPGGMTVAGIRQFENHAVRAAVMAGVEAARDRSAELGRWEKASLPDGSPQ